MAERIQKVSKKNSSTKESKPDSERERCSEPKQEDHCLSEDIENADVSFSQVQVVDVSIIPDDTDQTTEAVEGVEKEGCDEPEQEDHYQSEHLENTDVSFSQVQVVDVPSIHDNTQTTEDEEGVEEEGCDEPDGLFERIAHSEIINCLMPHYHHHLSDNDYELEGFNVHLPAHFHQFDCPRPFGARLNKSGEGYKLARVLTNTAAYTAGLRESDTLTHLNDTELHTLDISEIQKLFMNIETTFTLRILRKYGEGDEVHLERTTIRVTISNEVVVEIVHTEIVCSEPIKISTSALSFVNQKENDDSQIYFNMQEKELPWENSPMKELNSIYLDFYRGGKGQRCAIRNRNTNRLYDAVQNNMKLMKSPNPACLLDKIHRRDISKFVFESVKLQGHYLVYDRAADTLKLSRYDRLSLVPSDGSFVVNRV